MSWKYPFFSVSSVSFILALFSLLLNYCWNQYSSVVYPAETSELLTICGTSDVYALNDALWVCGNLFSNVRSKVETKRILLFTNVDSPYSAQDDLRVRNGFCDLIYFCLFFYANKQTKFYLPLFVLFFSSQFLLVSLVTCLRHTSEILLEQFRIVVVVVQFWCSPNQSLLTWMG